MRNQRNFSQEFKRQVVEELVSGESRPAQLCRRHNISSSLLYHWKKQYSRGKFNNEPTAEAALQDRIEKLERLVGRLTLENEFLKGARAQPQPVGEKRKIISRWKHLVGSIRKGCRLMNIARSTFYCRRKTASLAKDADTTDKIEAICLDFPGYGYHRVTEQLKHDGAVINHKRVLRLMRESDLLCRARRKRVKTTDSKHHFPRYPNLIKNVKISGMNQVWLADITYIRIRSGFVYLAAILDAYSRRVIGYAISTSLETSLTLKALRLAIAMRHPTPGVTHHSDQGVQYASGEYVEGLLRHGFRISMARRGNPYENATMESFFKTLKYEEVYLFDYETITDVLERIPYFIVEVYNRKRLHSALGYLSPDNFETSALISRNRE